jgi:hypothetical protein
MISFIEPYTPAWYKAKIGCFSASKYTKLRSGGTRPMTKAELDVRDANNKKQKETAKLLKQEFKSDTRKTVDTLFGAGAITYINEKVSEIINKRSKHVPTTGPMERGLSLEWDAIELFMQMTGIKVHKSGLFKLNPFVCATPDGHGGIRKVKFTVEVKCLNPENHSEICELETVEQLRAYDESFYGQCQFQMYVTGAKYSYFISYDNRPLGYDDKGELDEDLYRPENDIYCIKWFKVKRDEEYIKDMEIRLDAASGMVIDKLEKRIKTAQKNLVISNRTQRKIAA